MPLQDYATATGQLKLTLQPEIASAERARQTSVRIFRRNIMAVTVEIPPTLRDYCNHHDEIVVSASTVATALAELKQFHPAIYGSVCDETGAIRRHIHLFVNLDFVPLHGPQGLAAKLKSGDVLTIWTAVSGG